MEQELCKKCQGYGDYLTTFDELSEHHECENCNGLGFVATTQIDCINYTRFKEKHQEAVDSILSYFKGRAGFQPVGSAIKWRKS